MTTSDIKTSVNNLLTIFNNHQGNLTSKNGLFYILNPTERLTTSLNSLQIQIDDEHDTLTFKKFPIVNVFTSDVYENRLQPNNYNNNFIVVNFPNTAIFQFDASLVSVGIADQTLFNNIENHLNYYNLYNTLKSSQFADHHNDAEKEIIIYNSAKGILKIKYPVLAPKFKQQIKSDVDRLLNCLNNEILRIYLKNSLFEFSTGNLLSIEDLIDKGSDIISAAKRDQELATKQFDFEKFRDSLYTQKDKFFNSIRELLSKIYSQIVGIPISISASIFATYKVENNVFVSVLILVSFLLYITIYVITQKTYYNDILEIEVDFKRDFSNIKLNSGLPIEDVEIQYEKISFKILTVKKITLALIFSIIGLGACVVFFIIDQML